MNDIYAQKTINSDVNNERLIKLKNLPASFMFNLTGFDTISMEKSTRPPGRKDSCPPTNSSEDDDDFRKWVYSVHHSILLSDMFGELTRSDLSFKRSH